MPRPLVTASLKHHAKMGTCTTVQKWNMGTKHPSSAAALVQPVRAHDYHDRRVANTTEYIMPLWNTTYKIMYQNSIIQRYVMARYQKVSLLLKPIYRIATFYTHRA